MKYYTTEEVATMLKLDPETIRRYIGEGKIKAYKIGKGWRISESDLNDFLEPKSNQ